MRWYALIAISSLYTMMINHYIPIIFSLLSLPLTAGLDYTPGPYTVTFTNCEMYATLMVPTMDDDTTELSEYFKVAITSTDQPGLVVISSPNMTFITIEDNEPGNTFVSILHTIVSK